MEQEIFERIMMRLMNGTLIYPRFTKEEVRATYETWRHGQDQVWKYILLLESAKLYISGRGDCDIGDVDVSQSNGPRNWDVRKLGARIGWDPRVGLAGSSRLSSDKNKPFDRGVESVVYRVSEKWVRKFRKISIYSENNLLDELAKIIYHNYLFPSDAYFLKDIVRYENGNTSQAFLDLYQPFVNPKVDENGAIVKPTIDQIEEALKKTPLRFALWDSDDDDEDDDSTTPSCAREMAFNSQYIVYDFKVGRNTFIDATSGEIRFVDPRVILNVRGEPFPMSSLGRRKSFDGLLNDSDIKGLLVRFKQINK